MNTAPRSVSGLWAILAALLTLGLGAYVHFLLTGSYHLLITFFDYAGSMFFILMISAEAYFAGKARWQFSFNEPMYLVWTLIFLSACCRLIGALFGHVLSADLPWNPLVFMNSFHLDESKAISDAGLVIGGPVAMVLLAAGLGLAISLNRRAGILSGPTIGDRILIGVISLFTARELFEIGLQVFRDHARPGLAQELLWLSDPLLTLLLLQAVSIRRSVLNMGDGLIARVWGMMILGIAFTSLGDIALWADSHAYIPVALAPLRWFIWFPAATAYASAPCYQMEAMYEAHRDSYSALLMTPQASE